MIIIYKYPLKITDFQFIETHEDAKILSVKMQNGEPKIWILVDTGKPKTKIQIGVYGTGNPIPFNPSQMIFIDTIFEFDEVYHIFKLIK